MAIRVFELKKKLWCNRDPSIWTQWDIAWGDAAELYKTALPERDKEPLLWAKFMTKIGDAWEIFGERVRARELVEGGSNGYRAALTVIFDLTVSEVNKTVATRSAHRLRCGSLLVTLAPYLLSQIELG